MADSFNATAAFSLTYTAQHPLNLSSAMETLSFSRSKSWTVGTAASQADRCWADQVTVEDGSYLDIDLYAWTSGWGTSLNMVALSMLVIENTHATLPLRILATGPTFPFDSMVADPSDIMIIKAGEVFVKMTTIDAPYAVSSTKRSMRLDNPGGTDIIANVIFIGQSA